MESKIKEGFKAYLSGHNRPPSNVYILCKSIGITEAEFFDHFGGLDSLKRAIWFDYFKETLDQVEGEEVYAEYSIREKLLSFYYTLLEVLKKERTFTRFYLGRLNLLNLEPSFLHTFRKAFLVWINDLLEEGKANGEIEERALIGGNYFKWHWPQAVYVLHFWAADTSENFQNTDEAVERAVHLGFDLMGHNFVDSALGFAKFLTKGMV